MNRTATTFLKVWKTINEKHYDPTFGGVDWKKMRERYEPKALTAKSNAEFHRILRQMLGELKLSHFEIYPPPPKTATSFGEGGIRHLIWITSKEIRDHARRKRFDR